jgi:hypothetical protein
MVEESIGFGQGRRWRAEPPGAAREAAAQVQADWKACTAYDAGALALCFHPLPD